ncbi:SDR family oxidoreductase [Mesohalobacter halotolerans]|uniref:SDR family oxidoreductase n=1 Tax=Mesohalobacter halotolerans TaxID=1883405 RepID=A0A4U5TTE8_9FLAO|nr:SDR family oxidoreductase [Mesohalobacter halotolerans]MBS3737755.1 SDR family oxidoreductase [Psychroflexus sp.]TKS56548.1 SDR family oxidoreductase [Mesohalobacter halotolerans]
MRGKVAFITGGSKGIGYGIAESLAQEGVHSVLTSRTQANADKAAKAISEKYKVKCLGIEADVRDYKAVKSAVDRAEDAFGQIDYVIANAGLGHFGSVEDLKVEQWQEVIDTNLSGVFYTIKSSVEALKKTKGYFISISSLAGENFFAGGSAYNASKFGVTGFTQAVMLDLRQKGVNVSTIMPGSVSTYFNGNEPDDKDAWKIQIEDLGEIVVDLFKLNPRTLPSKIEVRPSQPPKK